MSECPSCSSLLLERDVHLAKVIYCVIQGVRAASTDGLLALHGAHHDVVVSLVVGAHSRFVSCV